jgi:hypothetical protein
MGQPFPFWVRGQSVLTLRVSMAKPEAMVRLAPGVEVSVAPRPRRRPQALSKDAQEHDGGLGPAWIPPAWLRLQVQFNKDSSALPGFWLGNTSEGAFWGLLPLSGAFISGHVLGAGSR